ncbi:MAG: hypothetical protein IJ608_05380 [Lachnospiraceae bacterium]|nr:hypothetical protein [Lachnospiraceae bacterium]MBR1857779.1 hypothetical protein [Oribacterium sp.]
MRAYKDPTADTAIANVMKEWKEAEDFKHRQEVIEKGNKRRHKHKKGRVERLSLSSFKGGEGGNDRSI